MDDTFQMMAEELASWTGSADKIPFYIEQFRAMEHNIAPTDPDV